MTDDAVKVKPPFPKLPIFNVSAQILSYLGYQDEIVSFLYLLNHNSKHYVEAHFGILPQFITWRPEITRTITFGFNDENDKIDSVYPTQEELPALKDQRLKMSAIHYMTEPTMGCLYSIQLEFANGSRSPLFQTRDARDTKQGVVKTLAVD